MLCMYVCVWMEGCRCLWINDEVLLCVCMYDDVCMLDVCMYVCVYMCVYVCMSLLMLCYGV